VDDELAFLLGRVDHLLPLGVLGGGGPGKRRARGEASQHSSSQHDFSFPALFFPYSVLMRFLMKRSWIQRNSSTSTSMSRPMTLTCSGLPAVHIFSITTDRTSVPGA